jgi:hypothetical protein
MRIKVICGNKSELLVTSLFTVRRRPDTSRRWACPPPTPIVEGSSVVVFLVVVIILVAIVTIVIVSLVEVLMVFISAPVPSFCPRHHHYLYPKTAAARSCRTARRG